MNILSKAASLASNFGAGNPITSAVAKGMSAQAILDLVMRNFPKFKNKIKHALDTGNTPDNIVQYLQRDFDGIAQTKKSEQLSEEYGKRPTDYQRSLSKEMRTKRETNVAKAMGAVGLAAAGAGIGGAMASGARMASGAIRPDEIISATKQPLEIAQQQPQIGYSGATGQPPQTAQAAPPSGPSNMVGDLAQAAGSASVGNISKILEQTGHLKRITNMLQAGTPVENVKVFIKSITPKSVIKQLEAQGVDIEKVIDDYAANLPPAQQKGAAGTPTDSPAPGVQSKGSTAMELGSLPGMAAREPSAEMANIPKEIGVAQEIPQDLEAQELESAGEPSVGHTAMLPNGEIGTIKDLSGDKTVVDVDGKERNIRRRDAIIFKPKAIKLLDQAVDMILQTIPESQMSTNFLQFTPLPDNKLLVQHTNSPGKLYLYSNVGPEFSKKVLSASTEPKTTGENPYGKHTIGVADSRGAPYEEIKKDPKKYPFEVIDIGHHNFYYIFKLLAGRIQEKAASKRAIASEAREQAKAEKAKTKSAKKPRKAK